MNTGSVNWTIPCLAFHIQSPMSLLISDPTCVANLASSTLSKTLNGPEAEDETKSERKSQAKVEIEGEPEGQGAGATSEDERSPGVTHKAFGVPEEGAEK